MSDTEHEAFVGEKPAEPVGVAETREPVEINPIAAEHGAAIAQTTSMTQAVPTTRPTLADAYPAGHPNLLPSDAATTAADSEDHPLNPIVSELADPVNDPLVDEAPLDAASSHGVVLADPTAGPRLAAFDQMRLAALEFFNKVRSFSHDVDGSTELGKLVNFVRSEFTNRK